MINIERPWMKPISMVDGNEVMASRGFKLIGIKLYSPNNENAIYHAKMMQNSCMVMKIGCISMMAFLYQAMLRMVLMWQFKRMLLILNSCYTHQSME